MSKLLHNRERLLSRVTIILSSICIVHCLSMPLVILALPAFATFLSSTVEVILILSIIPLSLVAFLPRWFKHRNYRRLGIFVTGLLLLFASQFFLHETHQNFWSTPENIIAHIGLFAGVIILASVIYLQNKHTHHCANPHHEH